MRFYDVTSWSYVYVNLDDPVSQGAGMGSGSSYK